MYSDAEEVWDSKLLYCGLDALTAFRALTSHDQGPPQMLNFSISLSYLLSPRHFLIYGGERTNQGPPNLRQNYYA